MSRRAVILSGALGLGHDVISQVLATSLEKLGWQTRTLDCMALLGPFNAKVGDTVFRRLTSIPSLYDALHFSHMRPGHAIARVMDRQATKRLVPAVRANIEKNPADLLISTFATGASTAAKLSGQLPDHKTIVLCTDVGVYRFWVWDEIDLFLVTSQAAAASVRRYVPRANTLIVPPPVRAAFYHAPSQEEARASLGIPEGDGCVLVMGGGWGLGPLASTSRSLAKEGVHVLAVAGRNKKLEKSLRALAEELPSVQAFGYTDRIPELMAATDLVVTTAGATTCSEARVMGRGLVLLDVVPGHGRENLQHELEGGNAEACDPRPEAATATVLAALDRVQRPLPKVARQPGEWDAAFREALASLGLLEAGLESGPGAATDGDASTPTARGGGTFTVASRAGEADIVNSADTETDQPYRNTRV